MLAKAHRQLATQPSASTTSVAFPELSSSRQILKTKSPIFSGQVLDWPRFKTHFLTYIGHYPDSLDDEKVTVLLEALSSEEARGIASRAAGDEFNFDSAMEALDTRYGQKHVVLYTHA